jgi:thioredoxin reductase
MEKERGITIIGTGNAGKQAAIELAKHNNLCVLHSVVDSQFTDLKEPEPFLITRLPEFKEPWINPNEPIINYKKHYQTCLKSRKKRKKKKRR